VNPFIQVVFVRLCYLNWKKLAILFAENGRDLNFIKNYVRPSPVNSSDSSSESDSESE
jgi:hypothetical protein